MNIPGAVRQQLAVWGFILSLWGLLVLAFAGQLVFTNSLEWTQALRLSLRDWLPWAILGPAAAWLAFRFPLERERLHVSIPVHVVACMLAVLFCEVVTRPVPGQNLGPNPPGLPFRPRPDAFEPAPLFGPEVPRRRPEEPLPQPPLFAQPELRRPLFMDALVMRAKFNIPIYWIIVSIVQALTYHRRSEERQRRAVELEARLAEAKLEALRMQLHPHFLFNTLNAISTLVHKDPHAADEMIANLSELLRATLDTAEPEVPLRQELEFLERYLEIQQTRFGDRLRIEKELDAAALDGRVPALILQPIVENAIRHGIEPQTAAGVVQIRVRRDGDNLLLSVRDNGIGPKAFAKVSEGIGLANTKARLQELYGSRARLTLSTASDGGCMVSLEIPYHEQGAGTVSAAGKS